jgi:hypothetical protein
LKAKREKGAAGREKTTGSATKSEVVARKGTGAGARSGDARLAEERLEEQGRAVRERRRRAQTEEREGEERKI